MREPREFEAVIAIVDDDPWSRDGLQRLIRSAGWRAETFVSAQEFLARPGAEEPSCLVLDLQLPGLSGLDLQKQMAEAGLQMPIVFLTGHGDIPASVQAIKAGAVEFLTKPVDEQKLLQAIDEAIERNWRTREQHARMRELRERYKSLTGREQEVLQQVVSGLLNKQIAVLTEHNRAHSQVSSRTHHAQDACRVFAGLGEDGGESGDPLPYRPNANHNDFDAAPKRG